MRSFPLLILVASVRGFGSLMQPPRRIQMPSGRFRRDPRCFGMHPRCVRRPSPPRSFRRHHAHHVHLATTPEEVALNLDPGQVSSGGGGVAGGASTALVVRQMSSEEGARELDSLRGQEDATREGILAGIADTPHYEPEVYFVAAEANNGVNRTDPNRTVGVISAQLRRRAPLIAGPGAEGGDPSTERLPSVPLPSPHVYLCNMYVDAKFRKRGVGTALLSATGGYARNWSERLGEVVPLVLSVNNDNVGAVRLYEKGGFEYLEKNDVFCVMEKYP